MVSCSSNEASLKIWHATPSGVLKGSMRSGMSEEGGWPCVAHRWKQVSCKRRCFCQRRVGKYLGGGDREIGDTTDSGSQQWRMFSVMVSHYLGHEADGSRVPEH